MVIAIIHNAMATVANANNADMPARVLRVLVSSTAASVATISHHAVFSHAKIHRSAIKVGASDHSCQRGDQKLRSADVPSRALLISRPSWPTASVIAMPTPIHNSKCCAARRGEPTGAERNAMAIGNINNSNPEAIGRAGAEVPPHQIPNAPTVASSAAKREVISTA